MVGIQAHRTFPLIRAGMMGTVSLAPYFPDAYNAKVVVVDKLIDPASSTFWVRLQLPNSGNKIPAGIRCNVKFLR